MTIKDFSCGFFFLARSINSYTYYQKTANMQQYKLELMIAIDSCTLANSIPPKYSYQFSVIDELNRTFDFDDIFYSLEAAESIGREAVKALS